ncbi:NADPH-dependent FMN reductase [Flavobacterium akiainvivens]|uniref:NADPH-dependent FMN reductase n=1 Tax=Flavobacterium akiainvivens TaxID=1202724 RepID=A0A0M9VH19_9FLAO|nr:NAD(P)H-dependent oxidoreductase [Flavobacterium akiainvivens]KOS05090.1 NADPH-dependent FMN reductase [Flavobacterium akiainvivens]SFQ51733.1 NAD(P)H-dependent FMN reductase [Flavobacterium akiainvivens]
MKLLAFAGSSSTQSINKKLVTYAAGLFSAATETQILDLNDYELPLFSVDREKLIGQPPIARQFLDKIEWADVLFISVAEHNAGMTAAFKNIYDWASRQKKLVFDNKPVLLMSTSPGRNGGLNALEAAQISLKHYGGDIRATFSLPSFSHNFDTEAGVISNKELDDALKDIITHFNYAPRA